MIDYSLKVRMGTVAPLIREYDATAPVHEINLLRAFSNKVKHSHLYNSVEDIQSSQKGFGYFFSLIFNFQLFIGRRYSKQFRQIF